MAERTVQQLTQEHEQGKIRGAVLDLRQAIRDTSEDALRPAERQLLTDLNIYLARTPGEPNAQEYHDVTK